MADYAVFSNPSFDPNEYANAILAADRYSLSDSKSDMRGPVHIKATNQDSIAKEDISVAISKLTFGIEDISKQIKGLVTTHHDDLLVQASNANALSGALSSVRSGLSDLDNSVEKLRGKVHVPYETLQTLVARMQRFLQASDILRRLSRFVILARSPMDELATATVVHGKEIADDKERSIAKAALIIAELGGLLSDNKLPEDIIPNPPDVGRHVVPLRSIKLVASQAAFVDDARAIITTEMENMVLSGLSNLDQTLLASSLQTAYNLGVLPTLVQSLLLDLSLGVEDRIRGTLDLNKISKDISIKETPTLSSPHTPQSYRSRVRTEPTNATAPQWSAALWTRLEALFQEMADCCIKVYTLERVLKMKRDTSTHVMFLDEAMKLLENRPSATFLASLSLSLQKHFQDSSKNSIFLQQTLSSGYPRLLRLYHELFSRISLHTDTSYSDTFQSPETVLLLRSLSTVEGQYLSKSSNKINEAIGQAFSGGTRLFPGSSEGVAISRVIINELDAARIDPLLVRAVAKSVVTSIDNILSRTDLLISRDRTATSLTGPSAAPQQISNASLTNFLYQIWSRLTELGGEHTPTIFGILQPSIQDVKQAFERLIDPMTGSIRRELGAIITKLHRINFSKSVDPSGAGMGGSSLYIKELTDKLSFVKAEIVGRYQLAEYGRTWVISIVKYIIRTFILHISIATPIGESGKLQMASDMTGLEFALNAFTADHIQNKRGGNLESIGEEYRALRAVRHLFFLENKDLSSISHSSGLPPLIVLHHILVRSPIPLPHKLHGWQEAEYVRWVDEHSEEESLTLVEGGVMHWEKVSESEGKDIEEAKEYIELARRVLKDSQK